jgi:hypothetical protein
MSKLDKEAALSSLFALVLINNFFNYDEEGGNLLGFSEKVFHSNWDKNLKGKKNSFLS